MKKLCIFLLTFFSANNNLFAPKEELQTKDQLTTHQFQVLQILKLIWDTEEEFCRELIGIGSASALSQLAFSQGIDESFHYPDDPTTGDRDNSYKVETIIRDVLLISCRRINKAIIDQKKSQGLACPDWRLVSAIFLCYAIKNSKKIEFLALENPLFMGACRAMNVIFSRIIGGLFCTEAQNPAHECKMDKSCVKFIPQLNEADSKAIILYFNPSQELSEDPNDYPVENALWDLQKLFRDQQKDVFDKFRPDKVHQPKL